MHDNKPKLTIWEINSSKFNLLPLQILLYFVGLHRDDLAPSDGQGSEIAYRQGSNIYFNDEYPFIAVPSSGSSSSISLLWVRHNIQKFKYFLFTKIGRINISKNFRQCFNTTIYRSN